jgi:FkbM family methyltransferase
MSTANAKHDVESGQYEKYRAIRLGDHVLDLGAHHGFFTELALNKVGPTGSVIAFEPHPENYVELVSRVRALNWTGKCQLINAAAWDSEGTKELWHNENNTGGHSLFRNEQHNKPITVKTLDIGQYLIANGFAPTFVKIDTEDSEAVILASLFKTSLRPFITLECHTEALYHSCRALCEAQGYRFLPRTVHVGVCYAL